MLKGGRILISYPQGRFSSQSPAFTVTVLFTAALDVFISNIGLSR
jgi:hypothetical protein